MAILPPIFDLLAVGIPNVIFLELLFQVIGCAVKTEGAPELPNGVVVWHIRVEGAGWWSVIIVATANDNMVIVQGFDIGVAVNEPGKLLGWQGKLAVCPLTALVLINVPDVKLCTVAPPIDKLFVDQHNPFFAVPGNLVGDLSWIEETRFTLDFADLACLVHDENGRSWGTVRPMGAGNLGKSDKKVCGIARRHNVDR